MSEELLLKLSGMSEEDKRLMLKALVAEAGKQEAQALVKEVFVTPRVPPRFADLMSDMVELVTDASAMIENNEAYAFVIVYDGFQGKASRSVINLARKKIYVDVDKNEWNGLAQFVWSKGGTIDSIYVSRKASQFNRDPKDGRPVALRPKVTKTK